MANITILPKYFVANYLKYSKRKKISLLQSWMKFFFTIFHENKIRVLLFLYQVTSFIQIRTILLFFFNLCEKLILINKN